MPLGQQLRIEHGKRAIPRNVPLTDGLAASSAGGAALRTTATTTRAMANRRLPFVGAVLAAPPDLAIRGPGDRVGIKLAVAGRMPLSQQLRMEYSERPGARDRPAITFDGGGN